MDWGDRFMASSHKEILINYVAQTIPTYVMSIFKLPFSVCDDLTKMIGQYWWGVQKGRRKMDWVAWDKQVLPKLKGGLGYRDMRTLNQILLAKQAWRLIDRPGGLCARLLRARYYPSGNLVDTVCTDNASALWRGIEHGLELLKKVLFGVLAMVRLSEYGGPGGFLGDLRFVL